MTQPRYDVVIATDARLPGGTTWSVAEEIVAQSRAGLSTALVHVPSSLSASSRPFAPRLQELIATGHVDVVTATAVSCRLLVFRHPRVAAEIVPAALPAVTTDQVLMIANQAAGGPDGGVEHYDPMVAHAALQRWTGHEPRWAPIGPLVRENLRRTAPGLRPTAADWVNVLDPAAWLTGRRAPEGVVRIGRHSRDHPLKWPASRADLLAGYPRADDIEVRVLGGAETPRALLEGDLPTSWTVYPFGAVPPARFLASVDVFVYHHHPRWVEAFGRTIIEAMASGAPVVLPPHFETLFEDAATYCEIADTERTIRALTADPEHYLERSQRAQRFVEARFSHATHVQRLREVLGETTNEAPTVVSPPEAAPQDSPPRRILLVSSNGAGVGHLMRLMAISRRLPDTVEPVFLTLSQAVGVVRDLGFHVEYLPSRAALDAPHRTWHELLRSRLLDLIDTLDVDTVVFDGTWPYHGLLDALAERPTVRSVWSRRAMWRADITKHVLHVSDRFDLIVEPGELAGDDDRGPTRGRRPETTLVGPITFLRRDEPLDRDAARARLGLPADATVALVQLGAGNINDTSSLLGGVIDELRRADPEIVICVTRSAIATSGAVPPGIHAISVYPLASVFAAFDVAVAASGYNTFHELLLAHVPTAFLPNLETATDDQLARARWAARTGVAVCIESESNRAVGRGIAELLERRRELREELLASITAPDGALDAATAITDATGRTHRRPPGARGAKKAPSARARLVAVVRRTVVKLPDPIRFALVRAHHRVVGEPPPSDDPRLPLPHGQGWEASTARGEPAGVMVVLGDALDDRAIPTVVDDVAALQRATGGFVPLFVTRSSHLAPFRASGYAVEVLPTRSSLEGTIGAQAAAELEIRRMLEIRRRYAVDRVITIDDAGTARARLAGLVTEPRETATQ